MSERREKRESIRIGVLDLGSNSFHCSVADVDAFGQIQPVRRVRARLGLAGTLTSGRTVPRATAREVERVAHRLAGVMREAGADRMVVVGTSALREAARRGVLARRIEDATDLPLRLLTGSEEAALTFSALRAGFMLDGFRVLGADLGGGSVDIAVGDGALPTWTDSLPLGATRLARRFVLHDPPTEAELKRLRARVRAVLEPIARRSRRLQPDRYVVAGGSPRAVARIVQASRGEAFGLHGFRLRDGDVARIARTVGVADRSNRLAIPGMKKRHADSVLAAAVVLEGLMDLLGTRELTVSTWGLREGVMLEASGWAGWLRDEPAVVAL